MHHVIGHLRKRQRDHDEVHAFGAQRERPHRQRIAPGQQHGRRQEPQHAARLVWRRKQDHRIRAYAQKRGLAKAHQAGGAHQQLQAERKNGKHHDLGGQVQPILARYRRKHRQRHKGGGDKHKF